MLDAKKELLLAADVDIIGALERFMDNEKLYDTYLRRFVEGASFAELENAIAAKDWEQALGVSHNLKGVTGSLGFTRLYELMCSQVTLFRRNENESAAALMDDITAERQRLLVVAQKALSC